MGYKRTTWVNGDTDVDEINMNNIEDGIEGNQAKSRDNAKGIAYNRALIDEIDAALEIDSKLTPTDGKFYAFPRSTGKYTVGDTGVDFAKIYAETVTQGANTITATSLISDKDGNTPTDLDDCNVVGEDVTVQDAQKMVNELLNYNIETLTGWNSIYSSSVLNDGIASNTADGSQVEAIFRSQSSIFNETKQNHKYFVLGVAELQNPDCVLLKLRFRINTGLATIDSVSNPIDGQENILYGITDTTGDYTGSYVDLVHEYPSTAISNGKTLDINGNKGIFIIDLTQTGLDTYLEALGYTTDTQKADFLASVIQARGAFQEETLTQSEKLTVSDVNPGTDTLTFTSTIQNTYPNGANVYRSNLKVNGDVWEFGGFNQGSTSWDLENATYDSLSFSVSAQDQNPQDIAFNHDGTKMYLIGAQNDSVYQYTLSTAYDVSTASYDSVSLSIVAQENDPQGIFFKPDGTKMYTVGLQNDSAYQYTLSTPWDLSTASYDSVSFSLATQDTVPTGIFFKEDGLKMYMVGIQNDSVYQYTLGTAWDISTLSYDSVSFGLTPQPYLPQGIYFKDDGSKMYVSDDNDNSIYEYDLSTPWDLSTASYNSIGFSVASQDTSPQGVVFRPDGQKMYVIGDLNDTIYQYSTGEDTITAVTEIDVRMNIDSLSDVDDIGAYLVLTNNYDAVDGSVSIVDDSANESYIDLVDTPTPISPTQNEIASFIDPDDTPTKEDKVTLKYNLTRTLTTDDVGITSILGGVA